MMKQIALMFVLLLANLHAVQADTLYRWTDKDGKVHYGDRPSGDVVKAERKKFAAQGAADEEDMPYEVRKAKQNFPVVLYVSASCDQYCDQARKLLDKRGIPFSEKKLTNREEWALAKSSYGITMIPSMLVGKIPLNGFLEGTWNNELDLAGYPRTVVYKRPKPAKPLKPADGDEVPSDEQPVTPQ